MKYYLIIICFLFVQCSNQVDQSGNKTSSEESMQSRSSKQNEDQVITNENSEIAKLSIDKIIKSGSIKLEVKDVKQSKIYIDSLVSKLGAYYENQEYITGYFRYVYYLDIRIPNQAFDPLVNSIEDEFIKIISKNIIAKDVSAEYLDLGIRMDNNLNFLQQYNMILKGAKSIADIFEVRERIQVLELEIDRTKGRLKFLDDKVKYSTLNLEIIQKLDNKYPNEAVSKRIAKSFDTGHRLFLNFLLFLINLWPFLILCSLLLIFRKRLKKIYKGRSKTHKEDI